MKKTKWLPLTALVMILMLGLSSCYYGAYGPPRPPRPHHHHHHHHHGGHHR